MGVGGGGVGVVSLTLTDSVFVYNIAVSSLAYKFNQSIKNFVSLRLSK